MVDLKAIFKEKIFIETKVKSIDSLFLNEDRLENTNYHPTYQRNYVWDEEKATYFIESIFLGTEIPPLIFFQKDLSFEVIDGRQRYETILRFVKGELRLRKSGLHKLGSLKEFVGKNFKELSEEYKDMFLRTKIRTIVFSFRSEQFSQEEEDAVKREIFQRYNSGITPLKSVEIDKAIYLKDDLNTYFKKSLKDDEVLYIAIRDILAFEKDSIEVIMKKIREMLVLPHIPIYYYANRKLDIVHRFFEFLSQKADDENSYEIIFEQFKRKVMLVKKIKEKCILTHIEFTRLLAECLYWVLSIIALEKDDTILDEIEAEDFLDRLVSYIDHNTKVYQNVRSSFTDEFKKRYDVTADFFSKEYKLSFKKYLSTSINFKEKNRMADSVTDVANNNFGFENLRINKPEPVSEEIEDICRKLAKNNFLMRPPYQRDEVINKRKSSAIIESLLLGIRLPPIFVFNRNDGVQEVIDGQQRLLSILGFIGQKFKDENGNLCSSKKEGFRLDLKNGILTDLNGFTFDKLELKNQQKIKRAELWIIEIDRKYNPDFEPIDLFIRLNNKPYPIRKDTFEMWNSYISRDIIDSVKSVFQMHNSWFYLRKKETRMENENLLITLAYFTYQKHQCPDCFTKEKLCPDKTVGIYMVGGKINCRLKSKTDITKILEETSCKQEVIRAINVLNFDFISKLELLCRDKEHLAKALDKLFGSTSSKRTQQNFYILWLLLADLSFDIEMIPDIRLDINKVIKLVDTAKNVDEFTFAILEFRQKYQCQKDYLLKIRLGDICTISVQNHLNYEKDEVTKQVFDIVINREKEVNQIGYIGIGKDPEVANKKKYYGISNINAGFNEKYVASLVYVCSKQYTHLTLDILKGYPIVYAPLSYQKVFAKVFDYIQACKAGMDSERQFFLRLLEIMSKQLKAEITQSSMRVDMVSQVELLPELDDEKNDIVTIYQKCSNTDSPIMLLLLKALNM
ncbi:DUF262 domain-containing protein [Leyella stercorea]